MNAVAVIIILFSILIFGSRALMAMRAAKKADADRRGVPVVAVEGAFGNSSDPNSAYRRIMYQLEKVEALRPKVMILQVNSPGSTTGAAHEVYARINELRAKGTKVVVLMQDIAASGGVYVSMASDHVIACPGTITGSIGVILQGYDLSDLLPHLKVKIRTIKSGEMKDILSPTRSMTDAEKAVLDDVVIDFWNQFCEVVAVGREMDLDKVRAFSDGRVFTGRQALQIGLVDELGCFGDALRAAGRLAGIPEAKCRPVFFEKKMDFGTSLRRLLPGARLEDRFHSLLPDATLSGVPLYMMPK